MMVPKDADRIEAALEFMGRIEAAARGERKVGAWTNRWKEDWVEGYRNGGTPIRPNKTPFRGDDHVQLRAMAKGGGFRFPYWFTAEEVRARGALVTRWDRGVAVRLEAGASVVFNAQDIGGLPADFRRRPWEVSPINREAPLSRLEAFIDDLHLAAEHRIDVDDPTPGLDEKTGVIGVPPWELFPDGVSYCRAIAHEVVHWARRERHNVFEGWGRELRRPWEEMVADIGAAFLVHDLTGSQGAFDDQVSYVNYWWQVLGEGPHAVMAAAAAAEASVAWLHRQAPGYRAAPVGTRVLEAAQLSHGPGRVHGDPMYVVDATKKARQFVREMEERRGQRHERHSAWFRDTFRLLEAAGRIDTGIDDVRNAVTVEALLAGGGVPPVQAEDYIETIRLALQDELEQAVEEIHRRWNTGLEPSAGIRL